MLFPTLPQILQIYLLALLLSTLAGVVLSEAWGSLPPRLGILIVELSFFTIILLFVRRMAFKAEDIFLLNAVSRRSLVVSGVVAVSANVLVTEVDDALMELARNAGIGFPLYLQRLLLDIQMVSDFATLGESLVSVVLVPGILEEIAFRGFVFAGLCFYRGPVVAVLGSSLLFASFHLDPWHFPAVFLLGIVFGVLVWLTHSIYPAVLAHVTNNLFSVAGVNLQAHLGTNYLAGELPPLMLLPAAFLFVVGLVLLKRETPIVPLPSPGVYGGSPLARRE